MSDRSQPSSSDEAVWQSVAERVRTSFPVVEVNVSFDFEQSIDVTGPPVPDSIADIPIDWSRVDSADALCLDDAMRDRRVVGLSFDVDRIDVTYTDGTDEGIPMSPPPELTPAERLRQRLGVTLDEMRQRHERGKARRRERVSLVIAAESVPSQQVIMASWPYLPND